MLDILFEFLFDALPRWVRWTFYAVVLAALIAVIVIAVTS